MKCFFRMPSYTQCGFVLQLTNAGRQQRLRQHVGAGERGVIPALWQRFAPSLGHIPGQDGSNAYGIVFDTGSDGGMEYLCAVGLAKGAPEPAGFDTKTLPAQRYLVFRHSGHVSGISASWMAIFSQGLPASGYIMAEAPLIERASTGLPDGGTWISWSRLNKAAGSSYKQFNRQPQVNTKEQAFMRWFSRSKGIGWLLAIGISPFCHAQQTWRALDPENTLVIDTTKGRLIIEMRPDMAPASVARVKMLAREKIYNGLQFHRVIGDFVAQTGNPNNQDNGKSAYPNLAPEMKFKHQRKSIEAWASNASDAGSGFFGSVPVQSIPISADQQDRRGWGVHCAGVMGMGRDTPLDSANSEFYFMLGASRDMDHDYTVVGRVVVGMAVLQSLKQGEPPANPDTMQAVRVLADLPEGERPRIRLLTGTALHAFIAKVRHKKAADFSVCDVLVPVKMDKAPAR